MDILENRSAVIGLVVAFIIGFAIGLFVFGWGLTPVEYTGAGPQHLHEQDQNQYLITLGRLYSLDLNRNHVQQALAGWEEAPEVICGLRNEIVGQDPAEAQRLEALAAVVNENQGCQQVVTPAEEESGGGGLAGLFIVVGLVLMLGLLVFVLLMVMRRQGQGEPAEAAVDYPDEMAAAAPPPAQDADEDFEAFPIARFETTYARGHDSYDDSFSIENAQGDFLGECGVGISESIGMDEPKNVTALEVWLFDKNDIRTVTKVIMSDHAYFDEAIKAKLAPKGEPVLAREGETIVLETATLIINAEITELDYGSGALPAQSFFDRLSIELSAWAKAGDFAEPDVQGRVDDMLEF